MSSPDPQSGTDHTDSGEPTFTVTVPPRTAEGPNDGLVAVPPPVLAEPSTPPPSELPTDPGAVIPFGDPVAKQTRGLLKRLTPRRPSSTSAAWILRGLAVAVVTLILLIAWQEEAGGQTPDPAPPEPTADGSDAEKSKEASPKANSSPRRTAHAAKRRFDLDKLERYLRGLERDKPKVDTESSESGTAGSIPRPANEELGPGPITTPGSPTPPAPAIDRGPVVIPPPQGPTLTDDFELPGAPNPLTEVPPEELGWHDGLELALALQAEFSELYPVELDAVKTELYQNLLVFSRLAGRSDNPLERLNALSELMTEQLRVEVTAESSIGTLLPSNLLREHRGSGLGWCVLALALSDRTRDLPLEPVVCRGEYGLRYENGAHRYVLSPVAPDRVLTDREFIERVGRTRVADHTTPDQLRQAFRVLTRAQFWGHVLSEGGIDRIGAGVWARGLALIAQGLDLDPTQPRARVAQARAHLERNETSRALECLNAAVLISPDHRPARRDRVELLLELGRIEEAADDLAHLSRTGNDPGDTLRYSRWWLERREYRRAHDTVQALADQDLSIAERAAAESLTEEIAAAPWIAVLLESGDDRARLQAARRLGSFTLTEAREALIHALTDANGRIANVALTVLRDTTGHTFGREPELWRAALREDAARTEVP